MQYILLKNAPRIHGFRPGYGSVALVIDVHTLHVHFKLRWQKLESAQPNQPERYRAGGPGSQGFCVDVTESMHVTKIQTLMHTRFLLEDVTNSPFVAFVLC